MDKFVFRKKDAKAPPAPNTNASDADLPPLKYTSLALVRTWAQMLFGVSQVTGSHCWFRSALGCILGVTVFSPYVKTVVEYCIDRILSVFKEMGVNLLKGGETYVDRGDKRPTESPTYNPYVYMFGEAVRLPIMALTCSAAELIEQCIISHCKKVFKCANQRPEGPGRDGSVLGIRNERPATFYLAPLQPFIATVSDYLREMRNTSMIQRATLQLRTHGSVDIRIFAASTSKTTSVTSNVAIDLSDNVEIHETHVKSEQASSLKSDLSSDPDLVSVLQGMFLPEVLDEILSGEDPVFLNRVLKNMQSDGLGSYSVIDLERYVSLKSNCKEACPCLILSNPTNSHREILGAFRSLNKLVRRIGGRFEDIPKVVELRKAGLAGIPIRNNHLVVRMFHPSDIITPEQVITDCGNDPSKKTTLDEILRLALTAGLAKAKKNLEKSQEVHGHVKIICKAMYPDLPGYSRIFDLGTKAFARENLTGKNRIFHVAVAGEFGSNVAKGGAKGATFPGKVVRQGECKGKYFHGFTAIMVNKTTGEILTEEEWSKASMIRDQNGNRNGNKKTKTK
jgi:hypothetical protein